MSPAKSLERKVSPNTNGTQYDIECSIDYAAGKVLDFGSYLRPKKFRLLSCWHYLRTNTIQVIEMDLDIIKTLAYATISYVWKGNRKSQTSHSFGVKGGEDGDRIDLKVLRLACATAMRSEIRYIWFDRLCIMQTSVEDTNWQVMNMGAIYGHSSLCLVLPGGIGGLVSAHETTSWINRAWTLQEAILPESIHCIIEWTRGTGFLGNSTYDRFIEVHDGSLTLELKEFLHLCLSGDGALKFRPAETSEERSNDMPSETVSFGKFFSDTRDAQMILNNILGSDEGDERDCMIWRCALMRSATYDTDAVYSIMGLFGVQLDPSRYKTRSQALNGLLQELTKKGKKATWLAASLVNEEIFPNLPIPANSSERRTLVRKPNNDLVNAYTMVKDIIWYVSGAPKYTIPKYNFVEFTAPFSLITISGVKSGDAYHGFTHNGTIGTPERHSGKALLAGKLDEVAAAVVLGHIHLYSTGSIPRYIFQEDTLLMLLEYSEGEDVWFKAGMAAVPSALIKGWGKEEVSVGYWEKITTTDSD